VFIFGDWGAGARAVILAGYGFSGLSLFGDHGLRWLGDKPISFLRSTFQADLVRVLGCWYDCAPDYLFGDQMGVESDDEPR